MPEQRDPSWRLRGFARIMRHNQTDAEQRLWSRLRDRKLGGFKFRRQVPVAGFIADFYCMERALVVELDGGQHADDAGKLYDERRSATLRQRGIRVLRFSNVETLKDTDSVCRTIFRELEQNPHPSPLPEYREREQGGPVA